MEFQGPFDKNARRALAASVHRAGMLGRETVGTEHLLLGLSASAGGTASKLLADAGAGRDPFIAGVHLSAQILIRHYTAGQCPAGGQQL